MPDTLHMETTKISVEKTVGQIESVLVRYGVKAVWKDYENGRIEGFKFLIAVGGVDVAFRMPFRWEAIQRMAKAGKTGSRKTADEDQARRVAARQVLRWVEAQMALVGTEQVRFDEVFLPYVAVDAGATRTLYQSISERGGVGALASGRLLLEAHTED